MSPFLFFAGSCIIFGKKYPVLEGYLAVTVTSRSILPGFSLGLLGCVARTTINVCEGFPVCVYCMVISPSLCKEIFTQERENNFKTICLLCIKLQTRQAVVHQQKLRLTLFWKSEILNIQKYPWCYIPLKQLSAKLLTLVLCSLLLNCQ